MISIILCAGKGSRISNLNCPNKCLLRFQDVSLLQKTLSYVNELDEISKVIIVVNYNKDEVIAEAKKSTHKELVIVEQRNLNGMNLDMINFLFGTLKNTTIVKGEK